MHSPQCQKVSQDEIPLKDLRFIKQIKLSGKPHYACENRSTWLGRYRNIKVLIKKVEASLWWWENGSFDADSLEFTNALSKLHHRNIVHFFGYAKDPKKRMVCYVFEFLDSKEGLPLNLKKLLRWVPPDRFPLKLKVI